MTVVCPAGDHVKFGLPMSASATLLTWSLVRFKDGYIQAGQLDMMYDMIKWPLDYFLKAWDPNSKELVVQVTTTVVAPRGGGARGG